MKKYYSPPSTETSLSHARYDLLVDVLTEPQPLKKKIPCCVGGFLRVCMVLMCASVKRTMATSPSNGYSHLRHD